MATKSKLPRKVFVLDTRFGDFAFDSATKAAQAMDFFSKLEPVEYHYDGSESYYTPGAGRQREMRIIGDVPLEANERNRTLPLPKAGAERCPACESADVLPGENCPACGSQLAVSSP